MSLRLSTANTYDATISNLLSRQSALSALQIQLSAGKRITQASDDPSGAGVAARANTQILNVQTTQTAVAAGRDCMVSAESTLGDCVGLLQSARDALVQAGNGSYTSAQRSSLAQQLSDTRDQLMGLANQSSASGQYCFGGQSSVGMPFTASGNSVSFNGNPGQAVPPSVGIPTSLDGRALFMSVPTGNGVFRVAGASANTGSAWSDSGQVLNPSALTGNSYAIQFSVAAGLTTFTVTNTSTGGAVLSSQPYSAGQAIAFDGQSVAISGAPANGDQFTVAPSGTTDVFAVLSQAIAGLSSSNDGSVMQTVQQGLASLDLSLDRVQAGRSQAGDWMNRADAISSRLSAQTLQLTDQQSQAQDMDMMKGLSDFQLQQTAYDAALKTYAQVQHLSLFQYING